MFVEDEMEKEELKKYHKEYYQKNKEKMKAHSRIYQKENKERYRTLKNKWRKKNMQKARESFENYKKQNKEKYTEKKRVGQINYSKKYPKKIKAHNQANLKIKILNCCEECGSTENLQKHHPDYNKPLYVKILCRNCHTKVHSLMKVEI